MHSFTIASALLFLPLATIAVPTTAPSSGCAAVGIITARGSGETAGEGLMGAVAEAIQSQSSQTVSRQAVDYSASLADYVTSVKGGITAMTSDLDALVGNCSDMSIVLLGYSQGAEVVGDTLGGGGILTSTTAVDYSSIGSHVKAVIMYGDPRFDTDQTTIHVGTCTQNGLYARTDDGLEQYYGITQSYCDTGDPFCCSGSDILTHIGYFTEYDTKAVSYVLDKIGG